MRNASNKGTGYTLTVRKGGTNKLIKISYFNGKYGFCEPYEFSSVVELVNYYREVSLAHCNTSLDVKLLYSLTRAHEEELATSVDLSSLVCKFQEIQKEFTTKTKYYDDFSRDYDRTELDTKAKKQALDAFWQAVKIFEEQIRLQEKFQKEAQPHEITALMDNCDLLKLRLKALIESRNQLEENLKIQVSNNRALEREMTSLKPDIMNLFKLRDRHKM